MGIKFPITKNNLWIYKKITESTDRTMQTGLRWDRLINMPDWRTLVKIDCHQWEKLDTGYFSL